MEATKICTASRCPMMIDRRGLLRSAGVLAGAAAAAESDLERQFKAYCKLAGIEVVHI